MDKKKKNILIIASVVMIVIALVIVFTREVPNTTSSGYEIELESTTVDNLRFANGKLTNGNLVVQVQNTLGETYSLKTIDVTFKNESNQDIITISGYIGESLETNEIRNLNIKSDVDLSNTKTVSYKINK